MKIDELKKLHCGLIKCPHDQVPDLMPEIVPVLDTTPVDLSGYTIDAKVHMLMPGMYPCIPNWHGDAIPRNEKNELQPHQCSDDLTLYMWLSGPPLTEFQDGRKIQPQTWIPFKQRDIHRGTQAQENTWRLFIRLMPNKLVVRPRSGNDCLRRHSQVYLDANKFAW